MNVDLKRSANFTTTEVEYLVKLVNERKQTIECKKTDRTTAAEKNSCWLEIQDDFNSQFGGYRIQKTLKVKYDNMKKNAKKNYALDKQAFYKTGGGPKPKSNVSAMDSGIIEMLDEEQVEGLPSIYDDDKIENAFPKIDLDEDENGCFIIDDRFEKSAESSFSEESPKQKWNKYTPKMLKGPKHYALNAESKKKTRDVWADVAKMKLKKYELEIKVIEEEAKFRKTKLELEIEELKHKVEKSKSASTAVNYPKEFSITLRNNENYLLITYSLI